MMNPLPRPPIVENPTSGSRIKPCASICTIAGWTLSKLVGFPPFADSVLVVVPSVGAAVGEVVSAAPADDSADELSDVSFVEPPLEPHAATTSALIPKMTDYRHAVMDTRYAISDTRWVIIRRLSRLAAPNTLIAVINEVRSIVNP